MDTINTTVEPSTPAPVTKTKSRTGTRKRESTSTLEQIFPNSTAKILRPLVNKPNRYWRIDEMSRELGISRRGVYRGIKPLEATQIVKSEPLPATGKRQKSEKMYKLNVKNTVTKWLRQIQKTKLPLSPKPTKVRNNKKQ